MTERGGWWRLRNKWPTGGEVFMSAGMKKGLRVPLWPEEKGNAEGARFVTLTLIGPNVTVSGYIYT